MYDLICEHCGKKVNKLEPHKQLKYVVICSENNAKDKIKIEKINMKAEEYDDEFFIDENYSEYDMVYWSECLKKLNKTDMDILYLLQPYHHNPYPLNHYHI